MPTIQLQSKEKILLELKPSPKVKKLWALKYAVPSLFVAVYLGMFTTMFTSFFTVFYSMEKMFSSLSQTSTTASNPPTLSPFFPLISNFLLFFLIYFGSVWFIISRRYKNEHYWITNKRIVIRRGLLGYKIVSVPYNKISDIIVSHSFIERLFGLSSVHIQTLAGQFSRSPWGAEISLVGLENADEVAKLITQFVGNK